MVAVNGFYTITHAHALTFTTESRKFNQQHGRGYLLNTEIMPYFIVIKLHRCSMLEINNKKRQGELNCFVCSLVLRVYSNRKLVSRNVTIP